MTEPEWQACDDPEPMLAFLGWGPARSGGRLPRGGSEPPEPPPLPGGAGGAVRPAAGGIDRKARLFACACARRVWQVFGDDVWAFRHVACADRDRPELLRDATGGHRTNPGPTGRLDDLFDDSFSRLAVDVAERWCDGHFTSEELREARDAAWHLARQAFDYHGNADYRLGDHYSATEHEESERSYLTARAACLTCVPAIREAVAEAAQAAREVIELGGCGRPNKPPTEGRVQAALLRCVVGNPFRPAALDPSWLTSTVVALAREMVEARDFSAMPILADALQDAGCDDAEGLNHCRLSGPHARGCWVLDLVLGRK